MTGDRAAYVALALTPGVGRSRMAALLRRFGTPAAVLKSGFADLCRVKGISRAAATAIAGRSREDGEAVLHAVDQLGGWCLLPSDEGFPGALKVIPEPPLLLFGAGRAELLTKEACAVVGSRNMTPYGQRITRDVAGALAGYRVLVSGMARGIDAEAHGAALDAGGESVGVLGNGLGVVYPAANRRLYARMWKSGCLVTEYPPGERPNAGSFPRRNRLISGLCSSVVVIEAGFKSGAMITVDCALAQGRDVYAVPGPIDSPNSAGCNLLIKQGATPLLGASEFLVDLGIDESTSPRSDTDEPRDGTMALVMDLVREGPSTVGEIQQRTGLDAGSILTALTGLELMGRVRSLGPDSFQRA